MKNDHDRRGGRVDRHDEWEGRGIAVGHSRGRRRGKDKIFRSDQ